MMHNNFLDISNQTPLTLCLCHLESVALQKAYGIVQGDWGAWECYSMFGAYGNDEGCLRGHENGAGYLWSCGRYSMLVRNKALLLIILFCSGRWCSMAKGCGMV